MRRAALILTSCLLMGCVASGPKSVPDRLRVCPTITVTNDHFSDAVITSTSPRRRLGMVTGLTTQRLVFCQPRDADATLEVHMIGGPSFTLRSGSTDRLYDGEQLRMQITSTLRGSWLQ